MFRTISNPLAALDLDDGREFNANRNSRTGRTSHHDDVALLIVDHLPMGSEVGTAEKDLARQIPSFGPLAITPVRNRADRPMLFESNTSRSRFENRDSSGPISQKAVRRKWPAPRFSKRLSGWNPPSLLLPITNLFWANPDLESLAVAHHVESSVAHHRKQTFMRNNGWLRAST